MYKIWLFIPFFLFSACSHKMNTSQNSTSWNSTIEHDILVKVSNKKLNFSINSPYFFKELKNKTADSIKLDEFKVKIKKALKNQLQIELNKSNSDRFVEGMIFDSPDSDEKGDTNCYRLTLTFVDKKKNTSFTYLYKSNSYSYIKPLVQF